MNEASGEASSAPRASDTRRANEVGGELTCALLLCSLQKLCLGELRVVYDSELYLARIVMKNEQTDKVVCDCVVTSHS